jgi:hypothetical protein
MNKPYFIFHLGDKPLDKISPDDLGADIAYMIRKGLYAQGRCLVTDKLMVLHYVDAEGLDTIVAV